MENVVILLFLMINDDKSDLEHSELMEKNACKDNGAKRLREMGVFNRHQLAFTSSTEPNSTETQKMG